MKIRIIGAGQIGGILTRRRTKLGHEVFVANSRGPASLADLARETGAKPVSVREAARLTGMAPSDHTSTENNLGRGPELCQATRSLT